MQHAHLHTWPAMWPERIKLAVLLLLGCASLAYAEQATELSDDFLEYLGNMETGEDNWTDFAADESASRAAAPSTSPAAQDAKPASALATDKSNEPEPHHDAKPVSAPATAPKASK